MNTDACQAGTSRHEPAARVEFSFREFVEPHWNLMAKFARRAVASDDWEDVLQEALTTAWRKRRQYDPKKGSARSWLLAIVSDKAYKRRRRKEDSTELISDMHPLPGASPNASIDIAQALQHLSPRQRQAIALRYYLDMSTEETAKVMACSTGTVKSTLSDARAQLKAILGEDYCHA